MNTTKKSPVTVGLVGFGLAGHVFHAPLVHANPNFRLTHIVVRRGDEPKATYPQVQIVRSFEDLLATGVELIVVATPNESHFDFAARSLRAGKHVVVDKPFTITTKEADELVDLSRKAGRVLSVFQNRRWDGDFLTVRQLLDQKAVGRLADYESRFDRFRPGLRAQAWREQSGPGSGLLYDLAPHLMDQAVQVFGRPKGIYAEIYKQRDGATVDDAFQVHLEYPSVRVLLGASVLTCEPGARFRLNGTEGSFVKYGLDPQEEALKKGGTPNDANWGMEPESAWGTLTQCEGGAQRKKYPTLPGCYQNYYENVYQAIRGLTELAVKPEQAREVIRLIEAAIQSAREKRAITLS